MDEREHKKQAVGWQEVDKQKAAFLISAECKGILIFESGRIDAVGQMG